MIRSPLVRLAAGLVACLGLASPAAAETVGTLTLDALSVLSFGDVRVFAIPEGSTVRFHFAEPKEDGSIPFTITPEDVEIPAIEIGGGARLLYALAGPTSGSIEPTSDGRRIAFQATVTATLSGTENDGTFRYTLPFTTETTSTSSADGTKTVELTGMRLVEDVWHVQLVGATVNRTNAFPEPGTAVYTVLSGQFDRLP